MSREVCGKGEEATDSLAERLTKGPGKAQKRKNSRKQQKSKKRREFEENKYDYDSESTVIISDNDMPPLPSVQASTHSSCYLVRQNGFVGVDGFNAAMQKMRNESSPLHE